MEEEELVVEQQNSRLVGPMRGVRARAAVICDHPRVRKMVGWAAATVFSS